MEKEELLKFKEIPFKGKTKKFRVYSGHSGDFLGVIKWKPSWRCYVMDYGDVEMSVSCNEVLNKFIKNISQERLI